MLSFSDWKQIFYGLHPDPPSFTEKDYPDLTGKVIVITGGSSGLGLEVIKLLSSTNAKVINLSRRGDIKIDLSDLDTIKPAVQELQDVQVDILIHNAGVMYSGQPNLKSKQGYEIQLATNCLGPWLLQKLLKPRRTVWVASTAHYWSPKNGFNFDDPNFEHTKAGSLTLYAQSKAVNIIQSRAFENSVAICPGYLKTSLSRHLSSIENFFGDMITHDPKLGAYTELFAALGPAEEHCYYIGFGKLSQPRKDILVDNEKVWQYLDKQIEKYMQN